MERDKKHRSISATFKSTGRYNHGYDFISSLDMYIHSTYHVFTSTIQTKTRRLDVLVSPLPLHSLSYFPLYLYLSPPLLLHVIAS